MSANAAAAPDTIAAPTWCSVQRASIPADALKTAIKEAQANLDMPPNPGSIHVDSKMDMKGAEYGELHKASEKTKEELPLMRDAALAWYGGAGDRYLDMAKRYLLTWADAYKPDFDPIDEQHFDALFDTYAIIRGHLDPAQQAKATAFIRDFANGYLSRMDAHPEDRETTTDIWDNNFQSFRLKLVTYAAAALGDKDMFAHIRKFFWLHLKISMKPDGTTNDFEQRDAIYYDFHDKEQLLLAALVARSFGDDWYHAPAANGASLEKGVQWLVPYLKGEKTHEEFAHSTVDIDKRRKDANRKGFSGNFDPKTAASLPWIASRFDPKYRTLAESLGKKDLPYLAICGQ